jgi:DNA-binding NtrC family response regulator
VTGLSDKASKFGDRSILVVDCNPESLASIGKTLQSQGLEIEMTSNAAQAVERVMEKEFDVIIVSMEMSDITGLEFLNIAKTFHPETDVLLITGNGSVNSAVSAMSLGAFDYLTRPFDMESLTSSVRRALRKRAPGQESEGLGEPIPEEDSFCDIVGASRPMREIFCIIRKVAATTAPVIILGESGTGKELIARAIHQNSRRKDRKFLAINSASLPESLLESELFGYRKGAFTGAQTDKVGLLESANGGTLLLDEIASMSRQLQGKLLRVMQENEVIPVGGSERIKIDVRIIAASNRDLWAMVRTGEFRRDIYYRLSVIEITVPPLRERRGDIPLLAQHFMREFCKKHGVEQKVLGKAALKKLVKYDWPGNVRELENVIRRAIIVTRSRVIQAGDVTMGRPPSSNFSEREDLLAMPYHQAKDIMEAEFRKAYISRILSECGGSVSKAARHAGLSRQCVHHFVKKYGLKSRFSRKTRRPPPKVAGKNVEEEIADPQ